MFHSPIKTILLVVIHKLITIARIKRNVDGFAITFDAGNLAQPDGKHSSNLIILYSRRLVATSHVYVCKVLLSSLL